MSVGSGAIDLSSGRRQHFAGGETWLSRSAASVQVAYVVSSGLPLIVGSLQYGDLWLMAAMVLTISSRRAMNSVLGFFRSGYGGLCFYTSAAMLLATLNAPSVIENLKSIAQLMVVMWVVIPLVASGVANMRFPLRFLEIGAWLFWLVVVVGGVLQLGFQVDWFFFRSGSGRLLMTFYFGSFGEAALCLPAVYLFKTRQLRWRYLVLLLGFVLSVIFAASRTGVVAVVAVLVIASIYRARNWRSIGAVLIVAVLAGGLLFTDVLQTRLGIVDRFANFFEDYEREQAAAETWQAWTQSPSSRLLGVGWGESGYFSMVTGSRVMAHNLPLQVLGQAGILTAVGLFALLALPLFWWWKYRRTNELESTFVLLLFISLLAGWVFHPISYWRSYWLPFAVVMGMGYRLYVVHKNGTCKRE